MGTDDFSLDSDSLRSPFQDSKFQADTTQFRLDIEGALVGYSRDLYERFQLLRMTDSDCHRNTETGEEASSLAIEIFLALL
jgi:hypothetical protein